MDISSPQNRKSSRSTGLQKLAARRGRRREARGGLLPGGKLLWQCVISLVIVGALLAFRFAPAHVAVDARGMLFSAFTEDADWVQLAGRALAWLSEREGLPELSVPVWMMGEPESPGELSGLPVERSADPVENPVLTSLFGWRRDEQTGTHVFHSGVDLRAETGTPVRAFADGRVVRLWTDELYGVAAQLSHAGGVTTLYAHLSETAVREGDEVSAGEVIAYSGESGNATAPHLHFELHLDGRAIDPAPFLELEDN